MYEVRKIRYSEKSYKKILTVLRESLVEYFTVTVQENIKEADVWFERIESIVKSESDAYISFEIRCDDEVMGFITTRLVKNEFFLIRHFFIIDTKNREELAYMLLKAAIECLKQTYNIERFRNAAFTFPEDLLSKPFKRLGFKTVKRHNMNYKLDSFKPKYELPEAFLFTEFKKDYVLKIAETSVELFKDHPDSSFWDEINTVPSYLKYLEASFKTYFLRECSFIAIDQNGEIAGFCLIEKGDEEDEVIIQDIGVIQKYQGRGIGKALLSKVLGVSYEQGYKKVILTVTDGIPAQKLYENFGFKKYTSFLIIANN
ncbi:MAG: GNAT family N-acetyltransferase [Promethearchaeota archaeon]